MRWYIKFIIVSIGFVCLTNSLLAQNTLSACLEQGKKEYAAQQYTRAQATFEKCLTWDKHNVDTLLSLAGLQLSQEKLEESKKYFLEAAKYMKRSSPYLSYTYSMLGDIALKQQQHKKALEYYNKSLSYNEAYVNSLVGKGVITETLGDKKEAARMYQTALAVEPLNLIARKRLISLEPIYFSDEEILEALKQRRAVFDDKEVLSEEDRALFKKIHAAEQRGGLDYLKNKYPKMPEDYIITLFKDTRFARDVMTISGYHAMQKQIGQDAVAVFQKAGVRIQDVFDLRDLQGNKIFLEDSTLTDSGFFVYNEALRGRRMYLLPTEDVPPTQEFLNQIAQRVKELNQKGYTEISKAELALLKQKTDCSEETLRRSLGMYVLPVTKNEKRYFVYTRETSAPRKGVSWYYVARYRARKNPDIKPPSNSLAEMYESWNYKLCLSVDGELVE